MKTEIKKLLNEVAQHRKLLIVVAVTGVLYALAYSRLALLLKDLTDYLSAGDVEKIKPVIGMALGLSLLSSISKYFHLYLMNYITELVSQGLREKLHSKFTRLSLSFYNNYTTGPGGLISRVLNDIKIIQDGLRMVADIFLHPLLFILLLGNLIYLDWQLTLFAFSVLPFIILILRNISRSVRKYAPIGQQNIERMTGVIKESLDGIRIIQSFNLEKLVIDKFKSEGKSYTDSRKMMHSRMELAGPLTEFIATIIFMLVLLYITYQVSRGEATTGSFMAYVTSLLMLNQPLKRAQESYVRIQEMIVSVGRVFQIIDATHEVPKSAKNLKFPKNWQTIQFKNVSFAYSDKPVLKNINFTVRRGESIAFVGESGSGKSTILNLLERFFEPTSGEILIDGVNLHDFDLTDLRKNIALVSQDVFLFSDSIKYNILSGDLLRAEGSVEEVSRLANAHEFVSQTPSGYGARVGDRGTLFSGGEKQRISIARAMFKDAPILILDEATSALDSASEVEVQKGIDALMKGRTTFVVAHRLSTVQGVDRIFVIKAGEIVEFGTHQELISKKSEYYRFYQIQSGAS